MSLADNDRITPTGEKLLWLNKQLSRFVALKMFIKGIRAWLFYFLRVKKFSRSVCETKNRPEMREKRVLFATGIPQDFGPVAFETLLAALLTNLGHTPVFWFCEKPEFCNLYNYKTLGGRLSSFISNDKSSPLCMACKMSPTRQLAKSGFHVASASNPKLPPELITKLKSIDAEHLCDGYYFSFGMDYGLPMLDCIAQHARAAAIKFFAISKLDENKKKHVEILRRTFLAAVGYYQELLAVISSERITTVVVNHGIYVPQGIVVEAAKQSGADIVCWNLGYRRSTFILSHNQSYHFEMMSEPHEYWNTHHLNKAKKKWILEYLESRRSGERDWLTFQVSRLIDDPAYALRQLQSEFEKTVAVYSNVGWDAQLHFQDNVYSNMEDWLWSVGEAAVSRPNMLFVVRTHPAETRGVLPSNEPAEGIVDAIIEKLNLKNLKVIGPESFLTSYDVADYADLALVYGSKIAIELAPFLPVVVCGEAWVRNKAFTYDVRSRVQMLQYIDTIDKANYPETRKSLALKYAYYIFKQKFIDVRSMQITKEHYPPFTLPTNITANDLANDAGLMAIAKGIIYGTPFHYDL